MQPALETNIHKMLPFEILLLKSVQQFAHGVADLGEGLLIA